MGGEQSHLSEHSGQIRRNTLNFFINGKEYNVNTDYEKVGPETRLVDYIRDQAGLKGTKFMCREGGCGACIVTVKTRDLNTGDEIVRSVNSCLMPLFSCDGWDITTIEHLGTAKTAMTLHPIQQRMVKFSGSQCGFCTPGWVMNMYGVMQSKKKVMSKDVEDMMDGNICRCTGYRPILDAMKSLSLDASEELKRKCSDNNGCPCSPKEPEILNEEEELTGDFEGVMEPVALHLNLRSGEQWVKAIDLVSLFMTMERFNAMGLKYRVVAGNTGMGVFKDDGPYQAYVDLTSIAILTRVNVTPAYVILGAAVTISEAIEVMKKAGEMDGYEYCHQISEHWKRVANTAVRNAGTLAGNLMLKHGHPEFPSDIFLVLETIGAVLTIVFAPSLQKTMTPLEFLRTNMMGKIVLAIQLPKLKNHYFRSFKITRRFQNAHAYVNAGFLMQVDPKRKYSVRDKPTIVFGGISPNFFHAVATEIFFVGKFLDDKTIQGAMAVLDKEVQPEMKPPDADPLYRKNLTQALLYKFILGIMAEATNSKIKSGGTNIERGLSYGKQSYDTDKAAWPLYQPVTKLEAPLQVTGEAEYSNDIHPQMGELFGFLVTTKVGNAMLSKVNPSEALKMPGVAGFVDANDIPGKNNYMSFTTADKPDAIFVKDKIQYAGQPVGMILAESRDIAMKAAKLIKLEYSNVEKPILDIPSALEKLKRENKLESCIQKIVTSPEVPIGATHSISGEFAVGSQYHFPMEPHVCICIPLEEGMDIFLASQWIDHVQQAVGDCLNMPSNLINVQVRRLGGGFGAKLARASHIAAACAVGAYKMKRPVRLVLEIETMMCTMGKRLPYLFKYNVGFDDTGKLQNLNIGYFADGGCTTNEPTSLMAMVCMQNCYEASGWQLAPAQVNTNLPPNTYCRAPGSPQAIGSIEYIMDHIAFYLKKDPIDVRLANLMKKGDPILTAPGRVLEEDNQIPGLLNEMKSTADLEDRKKFVEKFNQGNRWKKRGLALVTMRYPVHYWFSGYNIFMSVFAKDGSIALSHSGIEMGQGINTKVAQVVARELQVPLEKVKVKPVVSLISANTMLTGGAVTSEHVCYSALKACEILLARLAPVKAKLENPSWELLIAESHKAGLDLTSYYNTTVHDKLKDYNVWGLTACEVEIDCLTGEYKVVRVDLVNDAGLSLSPDVDVGQVEGAFVFGMGLWLTEKLQHDQTTGELLTNRTWEYKPPASKDIPEDFRVTLMKNSSNVNGVLRSKATGEAPLCMSVSVLLAIKQAIAAARMDAGNMEWFPLGGPVTPEDIQRLCLTSTKEFKT